MNLAGGRLQSANIRLARLLKRRRFADDGSTPAGSKPARAPSFSEQEQEQQLSDAAARRDDGRQ